MYCPKCGTQIPSAPFCQECGAALSKKRWTKPGIAVLIIIWLAFLFNAMVAFSTEHNLFIILIDLTVIVPIGMFIVVVAEVVSLIVSRKRLKFKVSVYE